MFSTRLIKMIAAGFMLISLSACKEYEVLFSKTTQFRYNQPIQISVSAKEKSSQKFILDFQPKDFVLLEDGQPVSGSESAAGTQLLKGNVTLNTALLIDLSGSVADDEASFKKLKSSVLAFASDYFSSADNTSLRLGLFSFDGRLGYRSLVPGYTFIARQQLPQLLESIQNLKCPSEYCYDKSTNLNESLHSLTIKLQKLSDRVGDSSLQKNITNLIVYTDGTDRADLMSSLDVENTIKRSLLNHYGVTVGTEVNQEQIKKLSPSGAFHASEMGDLQAIFKKLVAHLKEQASANMTIEYCTPKRRGSHTLTVQVKYQGSFLAAKDFNFEASPESTHCRVSSNGSHSLDESTLPLDFNLNSMEYLAVRPIQNPTKSSSETKTSNPVSPKVDVPSQTAESTDVSDDEEDPDEEEGFKP